MGTLKLVTEQVAIGNLQRDPAVKSKTDFESILRERTDISEQLKRILIALTKNDAIEITLAELKTLPDKERYSLNYISAKRGLLGSWSGKAYTLYDLFGDEKMKKVIVFNTGKEKRVVQILAQWVEEKNPVISVGMCRSFISRLKAVKLPIDGVFHELLVRSKHPELRSQLFLGSLIP